MVAAAHPLAVEAGYGVLKRGGSAVDAAIAVQMVLGLVEPESSGIGGGAFLLHWSEKEKKLRSYDGRETAPAAAQPDRFLMQTASRWRFADAVASGRSVGVPGVLRMLELAHQRHGRLPWAELFEPAIRARGEGFDRRRSCGRARARTHLREDPRRGDLLRGRPHRSTAEYADDAARDRARAAPTRSTAATIAARHRARGAHPRQAGRSDASAGLRRLPRARARAGVRHLPRMAHLLDGPAELGRRRGAADPRHPRAHRISRARRRSRRRRCTTSPRPARLAYADRARYLGDPDFVAGSRRSGCSRPGYLDKRAKLIGERVHAPRAAGRHRRRSAPATSRSSMPTATSSP